MNRNVNSQSQQHSSRIHRRVREAGAVDFFNILTGPALLEMTDNYLPEHRERLAVCCPTGHSLPGAGVVGR